MKKVIAILPGDGIGVEVVDQAVKVLKVIAEIYGHRFDFLYGLIGHQAIVKTGDPLPQKTIDLVKKADAVLFGAIGDPYYDLHPELKVRPEQGLLKLRKILGLYANLRPIKIYSSLAKSSPLKRQIIENVDFVIVRELISGIYFGEKKRTETKAYDVCYYTRDEIVRIGRIAFELALKRRNKLTLVDKANVLETSRLWRRVIQEMSKKYSKIEVEMMYVDNAAMQIVKNPKSFDVILTENMFGDILSDEASIIVGSIGLLPSASIGEKKALYEPIHGSYPKAAGKDIANPIGAIISTAMLLDYSFNLKKEALIIEKAVLKVLDKGYGTYDIIKNKNRSLKCSQMGDLISNFIKKYGQFD